jgi:hypothetical protein
MSGAHLPLCALLRGELWELRPAGYDTLLLESLITSHIIDVSQEERDYID